MPPKRKATKPAPDKPKAKQAKQDGQKAVSKDLHVPLDEGVQSRMYNGQVYIDDDGIIFDANLNQSNVTNNNKFYRLQLVINATADEFLVWTRWGRVGEFGQCKAIEAEDLESAKWEFGKKFKDKTGLTWEDRGGDPKKS